MISLASSPAIGGGLLAAGPSLDRVRDLVDSAEGMNSLLPLLVLSGIVAIGLALWALGGRFVKPSVVLVSGAAAGYAGFTIGGTLDPAIGPWMGLAVGVIAGAAIGHSLFRIAAGVLLAAFLAVAAPTAAAVALDYDLAGRAGSFVDAVRSASNEDDAATTDTTDDSAPRSLTGIDEEPREEPATARGVAERAGAWMAGFMSATAEGGEQIWDDLEPEEQRTIVATGVLGAAVGLALGTILPTFAMAVLTSGLGAALMLGAGTNLAVRTRPEWDASLPDSPIAWAAIWISVAFLGVLLQMAPRRKRPKRPAETESSG